MDISRLAVYGTGPLREVGAGRESLGVVAAATASALVGTYLSSRFLKKVTIQTIRRIGGVLLAMLAFALMSGLVSKIERPSFDFRCTGYTAGIDAIAAFTSSSG